MNNYYDSEIETTVIASLVLFHKELFTEKINLSEKLFFDKDCKEIFLILKDIPIETDKTIILSRIPHELRHIVEVGIRLTTSIHRFQSYVDELYRIYHEKTITNRITDLVINNSQINSEMIEKILNEERINEPVFNSEYDNIKINDYIQNIRFPKERVLTGYKTIDTVVGGLRTSTVSIIGASPSTGKTALSLNIANNAHVPTLFFSLEMNYDMILDRLCCNELSIPYDKFSNQKMSEVQYANIENHVNKLRDSDFMIRDDIYDIEAQANLISKIKPKLVIVDYIQKVTSKQKFDSRRSLIEYISGQYKQIAKYNNCHIMLLSQINRTDRGYPTMASLKESGALEADGDYIMLLYRPYVIDKIENTNQSETNLLVDKNKFGNTGKIDLYFKGEFQRFTEIESTRFDDLHEKTSYKDFEFL